MSIAYGAVGLRRFPAPAVAAGLWLAAVGFAVWIGLSVWGGIGGEGFRLREAWDTPPYFYIGLPAMALAVAAASYRFPERIWRWPLWLVAGHQVGVLLVGVGMQSGLSLVILTLALAVLLAALLIMPALAGALAARKIGQETY
jgi:hypothetical protein